MLRNELVNHFPVELRCYHETGEDEVVCDCGIVNLGRHPSIRRAKEAWAAHVEDECKSKRVISLQVARAALAGREETHE